MDRPPAFVVAAFIITFIPIPIIYGYEIFRPGPIAILLGGIACLSALPLIPKVIIKDGRQQGVLTLLQYLSIFIFGASVDLLLGLGMDGYLKNMMSFYIAEGERYFETAYGIVICYWDGIAHCAMYWAMLILHFKRKPMQHVALYWCGSILHSMVILLLGSATGSYEIRLPVLLNIPYCILPAVLVLKRIDQNDEKSRLANIPKQAQHEGRSTFRLLSDVFFGVYFVAAIALALLRGLAALGSQKESAVYYVTNVEPYIKHHTGFPMIQMVTYLFYFAPFYLAAICGLLKPKGNSWMVDWSLIHAGAAAQAQVGHILPQFHAKFDGMSHFALISDFHRSVYWIINLLLLVVPQLFALRCCKWSHHFSTESKRFKAS